MAEELKPGDRVTKEGRAGVGIILTIHTWNMITPIGRVRWGRKTETVEVINRLQPAADEPPAVEPDPDYDLF